MNRLTVRPGMTSTTVMKMSRDVSSTTGHHLHSSLNPVVMATDSFSTLSRDEPCDRGGRGERVRDCGIVGSYYPENCPSLRGKVVMGDGN